MSAATSAAELSAQFQNAVNALAQVIARRPNTDQLLAETVRLCGQTLRAAGAAVWVTENPDQPELILEHNLLQLALITNNQPLPGLNLAVRRAVRECKPLIVPAYFVDHESHDMAVNPSSSELLFMPMKLQGKIALVLCLAVPPSQEAGMHRVQIGFLQRMIGQLESTFAERHINLMEKDRGQNSKIVQFAEHVHKHLFLDQVAVDMANLSRDVVQADRITVELYPRLRKTILAVSNVDDATKRSALFHAQRLLLDYVRDRHVPVVLDRAAARQLVSDPTLQDAASAYFAAVEFDAFAAAPVKNDQDVIGVLLAEYQDSKRAQANALVLGDLARIASTSVTNALEYEAIPLRRTLHAIGQLWKKPTATKRALVISCIIAALAAISVLGFVPVDFSIKADCGVQPLAQVNMVAPDDGQIISVAVKTGDHVKPNDVLMVLDTSQKQAELAIEQQKLAKLKVDLEQAQKASNGANSAQPADMGKISDLQLQLQEEGYQIKLLELQIAQATVCSPIDGVVLTERVDQQLWRKVRLGDPLLDVAKFSEFVLVVDIPESEVQQVEKVLHASSPKNPVEIDYTLTPWPEKTFKVFTHDAQVAAGPDDLIAQLLPASQQAKTANVFHLQVPIRAVDLPPGMNLTGVTGRARVHVGQEPKLQQWTRGAWRLLRMTVFF